MVLRRRLHRAAVHGISSRRESCEIRFRFGAMRSAASLLVQSQIVASPAVRCSLYDMLRLMSMCYDATCSYSVGIS